MQALEEWDFLEGQKGQQSGEVLQQSQTSKDDTTSAWLVAAMCRTKDSTEEVDQ